MLDSVIKYPYLIKVRGIFISTISSQPTYRLPAAHEGIQVNVCKNPACPSFGVPEVPAKRRSGPPVPGAYTRFGDTSSAPMFTCPCCKQHPPIRSNAGIVEEYQRLSNYLSNKSEPICPNDACMNYGSFVSGSCVRFGTTSSGSIRWKCKACSKVFTQGAKATARQRVTHKNKDIFTLLVNKMPMRRIGEVTGLNPQVVYDKMKWVHRQCQSFIGDREARLLRGEVNLPKLYLAVDRQQYVVNWSGRKDKRNVMLAAIATADLQSGYVFGFNLNFDADANPQVIEKDAAAIGDALQSPPFQKYARLWLQADHDAATANSLAQKRKLAKAKKKASAQDSVAGEIEGRYDENLIRTDIEVAEDPEPEMKLPDSGMQVHEQYTIYGHFLLIRRLLEKAPKLRFYLDQDPGFRAAFLSLFSDRIKKRTADGFYVSVLKDATNDVKEQLVAESKRKLAAALKAYPGMSRNQVEIEFIKKAMKHATPLGQWGDTWVQHPFPSKAEPEKKVAWLTNLNDYTEEHLAALYLKGSLHAVDRFFMRARRMLSLAERPFATASAARRTWHGYSPYNPAHLQRILEIFRVHYNYCVKGKDGKTPAMRLGLAKGLVEMEKILGFEPMAKYRAKVRSTAKQAPAETDRCGDDRPAWAF